MVMSYNQGLGGRSEAVLMRLREGIRSGVYGVGTRLPTEKALCATYGVSRNTLRRAVERLRAEGLLRVLQGSGTYVLRMPEQSFGRNTVAVMSMFGMEQLSRLQSELLEEGFLLCLYCQSHNQWKPEAERAFLRQVQSSGCRGLLANCSPLEPLNTDILAALVTQGTRVIHTGWHRAALPPGDYLLPDYRRAGYLAGVALHRAGYRRLALIRPVNAYPISGLLEAGFLDAIRKLRPGQDHEVLRLASQELPGGGLDRTVRGEGAGSIGFFSLTREWGETARARLDGLGLDVPRAAGIVAVPMPNETWGAPPSRVDLLTFDIDGLLARAVRLVAGPPSASVRELIAPEWRAYGSCLLP